MDDPVVVGAMVSAGSSLLVDALDAVVALELVAAGADCDDAWGWGWTIGAVAVTAFVVSIDRVSAEGAVAALARSAVSVSGAARGTSPLRTMCGVTKMARSFLTISWCV